MRLALLLVAILTAGCSKKTQEGLPPATEWQADQAGMDPNVVKPRAVTPPNGDPHAGVPGAPPIGAEDDGDEPGNADPHAGIVGAPPIAGGGQMPPTTDVTKMGLSAPDKSRPIDPTHHISGVLKLDAKAKGMLKPDGAIFVIAKHPGADGQPAGAALAVDKLTWTKDGMAFELTEAQAMVAGTELTGDVIVMARYDQDSDAMTKQPGDVMGMVRVKVPADNVTLSLDTILK
jgi:hypothetical protein